MCSGCHAEDGRATGAYTYTNRGDTVTRVLCADCVTHHATVFHDIKKAAGLEPKPTEPEVQVTAAPSTTRARSTRKA